MVTAETAAVLPVLALVLSFALWAVSAAAGQVRCADAAREGARAAARGDPAARVRRLVLQLAPAHAAVSVTLGGGEADVRVSADVRWLGHGPVSVAVAAHAVAELEPGASGGASVDRTQGQRSSG